MLGQTLWVRCSSQPQSNRNSAQTNANLARIQSQSSPNTVPIQSHLILAGCRRQLGQVRAGLWGRCGQEHHAANSHPHCPHSTAHGHPASRNHPTHTHPNSFPTSYQGDASMHCMTAIALAHRRPYLCSTSLCIPGRKLTPCFLTACSASHCNCFNGGSTQGKYKGLPLSWQGNVGLMFSAWLSANLWLQLGMVLAPVRRLAVWTSRSSRKASELSFLSLQMFLQGSTESHHR